jgi:hypothetical protein
MTTDSMIAKAGCGSSCLPEQQENFGVVQDTALRDLTFLHQLKLLLRQGRGRSTRYVPGTDQA